MQVSREVHLSALQKLVRCFALLGQKHQAHLAEVATLKESHRAEVEEVKMSSHFLSYFQKHFLKGSNLYIVFFFFCSCRDRSPFLGMQEAMQGTLRCPLLRLGESRLGESKLGESLRCRRSWCLVVSWKWLLCRQMIVLSRLDKVLSGFVVLTPLAGVEAAHTLGRGNIWARRGQWSMQAVAPMIDSGI